jgi:hypothetical protein
MRTQSLMVRISNVVLYFSNAWRGWGKPGIEYDFPISPPNIRQYYKSSRRGCNNACICGNRVDVFVSRSNAAVCRSARWVAWIWRKRRTLRRNLQPLNHHSRPHFAWWKRSISATNTTDTDWSLTRKSLTWHHVEEGRVGGDWSWVGIELKLRVLFASDQQQTFLSEENKTTS